MEVKGGRAFVCGRGGPHLRWMTHSADRLPLAISRTSLRQAPWPKPLPSRVQAVRAALQHADIALTVEDVAARFEHPRRTDIEDILVTLTSIGFARSEDGEYFFGV